MVATNSEEKPTVIEVVKALRVALGDTQQQFATRLGLAISTVVRYETTRPPRSEVLSRLYKLATENNLHHVAAMFNKAIMGEISGGLKTGYFPVEESERAIAAALVGLLRNSSHLPELQKPCRAALKAIATGYRLIEKRHQAGTMIFKPHEDVAGDEVWMAIEVLEKSLAENAGSAQEQK